MQVSVSSLPLMFTVTLTMAAQTATEGDVFMGACVLADDGGTGFSSPVVVTLSASPSSASEFIS